MPVVIWIVMPAPCLLQLDYRLMCNCPVNAMRDYGTGARKRAPVSQFNLFDATVVQFSRAARVRRVTGVPSQIQAHWGLLPVAQQCVDISEAINTDMKADEQ